MSLWRRRRPGVQDKVGRDKAKKGKAAERGKQGRGVVVIAAGGSGGHVFPALALAAALRERGGDEKTGARTGTKTLFVTDRRGRRWLEGESPGVVLELPAATPYGGGAAARLWASFSLAAATALIWARLTAGRLGGSPCLAAIGFGGYPSFAPLLGAWLSGSPIVLHEQNAVMGRANRALTRMAAMVTTAFAECDRVPATGARRVITGTPLRAAVEARRGAAYPELHLRGEFRLLIIGGSQGSSALSRRLPEALAALEADDRARLQVSQQCRSEALSDIRRRCARAGIAADCAPFFNDIADRLAAAHLIVARAGASTVGEIAAIGRPALFIPLPGSLDGDQMRNAALSVKAGAAWTLAEKDATPPALAAFIAARMADPDGLRRAAAAAARLAPPPAAAALVACLDDVIGRRRRPQPNARP